MKVFQIRNKRIYLLNALVMIFALVMIAPNGFAQNDNNGFYVGASVGQADQKDACEDVLGSCDDDLGWKVYAGYKFNQYFAIEGGAVDFGQSDADALFINVNTLAIVPGTLEVKIDGFFLSGLAEWPLTNNFSVLMKLGMIYWDIEFGITDNNLELIGDEDENGTDIHFGFGAHYNITENIKLRAEWERFNNIGDSEIGTLDIDLISAGVVIQF